MIAPCIVQSYDAPIDYRWNYVIGSRAANYFFNFSQNPCKYTETFTAKQTNGEAIKTWMTLAPAGGQFRVAPTLPTQAGSYEIEVTGKLSNWEVFTSPASTIDPSLKVNPLNVPSTFIYKKSFIIYLTVSQSPN